MSYKAVYTWIYGLNGVLKKVVIILLKPCLPYLQLAFLMKKEFYSIKKNT